MCSLSFTMLKHILREQILGGELIYVGAKRNLKKKVVMRFEEISEILKQNCSNPLGRPFPSITGILYQ